MSSSPRAMRSAIALAPKPLPVQIDFAPTSRPVLNNWVQRVLDSDGPGILRMLWRILGREVDVLDAYQDCFCKLSAYPHGNDLKSARAFAYRTAANIAVEVIRVRKRRQGHWDAIAHQREVLSDEPGQNGEADADPVLGELREAITVLPPHLRSVVVLRDLCRMPYDEVGQVLGIEPATARVYRRHAVVKLAELLGKGGCDEQH